MGALLCCPAVCAVEENYIIAVPVKRSAFVSVEVGGRLYHCHKNGVRISDAGVHMFCVPQRELNSAKRYSVLVRTVFARLPFTSLAGKEKRLDFSFRPLEKTQDIHICHISDSHGMYEEACGAGGYFSRDKLDLLILNGDIQDFSSRVSQTLLPYKIASRLTGGELPVIITRGNHDLRGKASQLLSELYPCAGGRFYYTARVGCIEFLVADCGEDKPDNHREYGGSASYHPFRLEETEFIERAAESGSFFAPEVKYRFILSHVPFSVRNKENWGREISPFDIEDDIYCRWCEIIKNKIKPQLFIAGHFHETEIYRRDDKECSRGPLRTVGCDTLIAGGKAKGKKDFYSANITVDKSGCDIAFANKEGRELLKLRSDFEGE